MDLDALLPLRKAGEYAFPRAEDADAFLPESFGNWLDPQASSYGELGDQVVNTYDIGTPCVLIDRLNWVYCANARPTAPAAPMVMYKGIIQSPAVYQWNPSNNYEGKGLIATLQMALDTTDGPVSICHGGSLDPSGLPLTNPVQMLYRMLIDRAGWTMADFDRAMCERTAADMAQLGYPAYWCFNESRTIRDWLRDILPAYHTDFTETGTGQLALMLDRSLTPFPVPVTYHVPASEIEDFGEPSAALRLEAYADDVVNQIRLHGRYNWSSHDLTATYDWGYAPSQRAYQAVYPAEFSFKGMYLRSHAIQWLNSHALRHGFEPRTVSFTLRSLRGLALIPPRFITVEWPLLNWSQHLLKVRKVTVSFRNRRTQLTCVDCGREVTDAISSVTATPATRRIQLTRTFTWLPGTVGRNGQLIDPPVDPRNQASNGDCEFGDTGAWDLYTGHTSKQWLFVEQAADAYRGRWYLQHVLGAGAGTAWTLRQRVDTGAWVVASAWFRLHAFGTNGLTQTIIRFYDADDLFLPTLTLVGNPVQPTSTYTESVAWGQVPAGAYYYRAGIGFAVPCTVGQWRADYLFAHAGSQQEILAARQAMPTSRNFVINGDFELGPLMWASAPLTSGWLVTNEGLQARSGVWYATHRPSTAGEERLNCLSRMAVTPGQNFTFQAWAETIGNPGGLGRLGVTWIDGQGNSLGENATTGAAGPIPTWALASGSMTVPANASYAHVWVGIQNHVGPVGSAWLVDDAFVFS